MNNNIIEPGTDITALLWKTLQSSQIQKQLDQSHNVYSIDNTTTTTNNNNVGQIGFSSQKVNLLDIPNDDVFFHLLPYSSQIIRNIDDDIGINDDDNDRKRSSNNKSNVYFTKLYNLYLYLNNNNNNNNNLKSLLLSTFIKNPTTPSSTTNLCEDNMYFLNNFHTNITNFIDVRKNKNWVLYSLSDNIRRYGTVEPHLIFNKMPGWLVDALQIAYTHNLYLIYSTDIRGVNEWLGQLCSLINLHNLLALNGIDINYTAILIHIAGVLSTKTLNPINRQGMFFSDNVLQKCTFENTKNFLSKAKDCDNLSSFISSTLMCLPQKSGTNYFDLLSITT